jgi:pimeloyl-ACP methyl ester carboxylesterase
MPLPVLQKLQDSLLTGPTLTLRVLQTIRRPVLIVMAGKDDFFAPAIGDEMRVNIKDSELIHYPAATHRVQVTNSAELVPAIRDFIARRDR